MGSQRFVKFVKSSSEVRQVCQKFVRFVRSSSSSSKVRQVRQKFVKFVRSSSSSSKVRQVRQKFVKFVGSLGGGPIGSQNNLFFLFWWTKQLIFLDFGWQTTYFVVKKWDLTNFWRTSDELDELLTNFWRTWRTFDELDELLTNLTNFWRTFDELLTNFWRTWRTSDKLDELLTNFWRTSDELDQLQTNLTNFEKQHVFVGCSEVPAIGSCCLFFFSRPLWKHQRGDCTLKVMWVYKIIYNIIWVITCL